MSTSKTSPVASRYVLEESPARALAFLRTVGKVAAIREVLASAGYTAAEHEEGWRLLHRVAGYQGATSTASDSDGVVDSAEEEIERWTKTSLARAELALSRRHPEQAAFLFDGLEVGRTGSAILVAKAFLDRCHAMTSSPERKSVRKEDAEALKTLEQRGITLANRKHIAALIENVHAHVASDDSSIDVESNRIAEREDDLSNLYAWLTEWRGTARIVIQRRDHLLRLGIGKRRSRSTEEEKVPNAEGQVPSPVNEEDVAPNSRAA